MKEAENHAMPERGSFPAWMLLLISHFPIFGDFYSITAYPNGGTTIVPRCHDGRGSI
ncbi:hypothetical protein P168DRAFT_292652, partial [Aspergillus campestris IBT 28561]